MSAATLPRVGMVGAGQLARMTHQAAIGLGVELVVLAERADAPAVAAGARHVLGDPQDPQALRELARACDVLTFDHERVPLARLDALRRSGHAVHPVPAAKALASDKGLARRTLSELGFPVPAHALVRTDAELALLAGEHGWPLVLKAPRGGYDGRGVRVAPDPTAAQAALLAFGGLALAEEHVAIAEELAVLVARRPSGQAVAYPLVRTVQHDGMCREMLAPAAVPEPTARAARDLALRIAEATEATGLLAVELFLTHAGELVVNELALRPHNSGHWTIEGAQTSQFEQHLRAVLDWPLGACGLRAPAVATVNVVGRGHGDPAARIAAALALPGAHVHLYGKRASEGRKLGHVTALGDDAAGALATARAAVAALEGAEAHGEGTAPEGAGERAGDPVIAAARTEAGR